MKEGIYVVFNNTTKNVIGIITLVGKAPALDIANTFDLNAFKEGEIKKLPQAIIKELKQDLLSYELVSLNQFYKKPVLSQSFAKPKEGEIEAYLRLLQSNGGRQEILRCALNFNPGRTVSDIEILLNEYGIFQ